MYVDPRYSAQRINEQYRVCPSCSKRIRKDELTHGNKKCVRCNEDSYQVICDWGTKFPFRVDLTTEMQYDVYTETMRGSQMSKYEIVTIGGGDFGDYYEEIAFDKVNEVSDGELNTLGGLCMLINCSFMEDDWVEEEIEKGNLFGNVGEIIETMLKDGGWFEGENKEIFLKKYGNEVGINWGIEYDDNCSVLLEGDWKELREEVKKEISSREGWN